MEKEVSKIEVRDIRDSDWYWISRKVFEDYASRIGAIGLALYNVYASYARDKGSAFPSQKTIAEKLGISKWTINKYNKILEKYGLIKIESGKGKGKSNLITLLKIGGVRQAHRGYVPNTDQGVSQTITKENNIKENTNVDEKSSVKEIFEYFKNKTKVVKGFSPEIDWGKDGRLVKKRLEKYSIEDVKRLIDWYLTSPHSDRLGCSLGVCLSANLINLWKAEKSQSSSLERLYPTWQSQG